MTDDFRKRTDELFAHIGVQDLADEIGCSPNSVKQARFPDDASGKRNPPPGWEDAVLRLAQKQVQHFTKLVRKLSGA